VSAVSTLQYRSTSRVGHVKGLRSSRGKGALLASLCSKSLSACPCGRRNGCSHGHSSMPDRRTTSPQPRVNQPHPRAAFAPASLAGDVVRSVNPSADRRCSAPTQQLLEAAPKPLARALTVPRATSIYARPAPPRLGGSAPRPPAPTDISSACIHALTPPRPCLYKVHLASLVTATFPALPTPRSLNLGEPCLSTSMFAGAITMCKNCRILEQGAVKPHRNVWCKI
jgi:hypothetical protein